MAERIETKNGHMVVDAEVNMRGASRDAQHPTLVLDGEPFPYLIDKRHGVKVTANDDNVHLVIVAIQVDRSVTITDHSSVTHYADE